MLRTLACLLLLGSISAANLDNQAVDELIQKGQAYILSQAQPDDSFWVLDKFKLGITAICVDALASKPHSHADDPRVVKAYAMLKTHQQDDGGIYQPDVGYSNYITSLSLICAATLGDDDQAFIEPAQKYLLGLQNTDPDSIHEGGLGYGSKGPGFEDLNNTSYAIQALRGTGIAADHPAMQKALAFVQRCQNLSSHNNMEWAGSDGGGVYSPDSTKVRSQPSSSHDVTVEQQQAETGRLASYGTMTYSLISSYITLDLKPSDPRVQAAYDWVRRNYRFDVNPGMGPQQERQGLYYYRLLAARTLSLLTDATLTLPNGQEANWKADLATFIADSAQEVQLGDGSMALIWVNEADRWAEGLPVMVTAYMVKALKAIRAE
jgi:hypothetical protein